MPRKFVLDGATHEFQDITLGNPFGPFASGRTAVVKTLVGATAKYREGSASVDLVAKYADDKLACIVEG